MLEFAPQALNAAFGRVGGGCLLTAGIFSENDSSFSLPSSTPSNQAFPTILSSQSNRQFPLREVAIAKKVADYEISPPGVWSTRATAEASPRR